MTRCAEVTHCEWIGIRLPLPPVVAHLVRSLLEARIREQVLAASLEVKKDIEARGYSDARPALAAA